jgi:multiple antibiotic resistance protein
MDDLGLTPLAIPLICGPGAIANAIILVEKSHYRYDLLLAFTLGTFILMVVTYLCLLSAPKIQKMIGDKGIKVIIRLMGLLLMVLAVEFFFDGLAAMMKKHHIFFG